MSVVDRLKGLRAEMSAEGVDAYVVYSGDAHNSEISCGHDDRRAFLTDFTGSAGNVVVTKDKALLWTDGRYFMQAEEQLDGSLWTLMRIGVKDVPRLADWINAESSIHRVGIDPFTTSVSEHRMLCNLPRVVSGNVEVAQLERNLVDMLWGSKQPQKPCSEVVIHSKSGQDENDKFSLIRQELTKADCDATLLTCLDEVAWCLNLRGADIPHSPVFMAYLLISHDQQILYINCSRLSKEAIIRLQSCNVTLKPYESALSDMRSLYGQEPPASKGGKSNRVWLDPGVNVAIYNSVWRADSNVYLKNTPVCLAKAKKNAVEIEGMREAHIRDGTAETTFLFTVDELKNSGQLFKETECTLQERIDKLRMAQEGNKGLSFPTISSIGSNGAVIHYRPEAGKCLPITPDMYLVDSGGQYDCGTTDVTRTVHLGTPTDFQIECFTRVLKGFISLSTAVFPRGTKGPQLDAFARQHLWAIGLDYRHGTGHGVGAYLNVHEGPIAIHPKLQSVAGEVDLEEGMVVSIEPGFYLDKEFGIRIENLVEIIECKNLSHNFGDTGYLTFQHLTLIPISKSMMKLSIMTDQDIKFVNEYHARVRDTLSPRLAKAGRQDVIDWLNIQTAPLPFH
eukprot:GHVQ01009725.1.p1 GENE.GHVQ01009725.1~~GHVQ01009725.1.p1  ORF type:complete len:621 (+),score=70.60 GHVQ01009725.1:501-2363(+)